MLGLVDRALTERIIGIFYEVYNELGYGFLESVYRRAMLIALHEAGLEAEDEPQISVWFRRQCVGQFEADILVEKVVMLELKSARLIESASEAQLLNELRATPVEVGLLLNFGPKPEFKRMVYDNARKRIRCGHSEGNSESATDERG